LSRGAARTGRRRTIPASQRFTLSGKNVVAEGITNPPIDELLTRSDSKYKLVLFAAKRARQINAYYSQLGEGLLDHVGPLVETGVQEKPLSIALREVNAGLLRCIDTDSEGVAEGDQPAEGDPSFHTSA
jgi:DNA-directed RNA polymerase subunit omega